MDPTRTRSAGDSPGKSRNGGDAPGYGRTGEQLADYEERTAILSERMALLRDASPSGSGLGEAARRDARRKVAGALADVERRLAELDERIAARTAYALRLGIELPLELIRERFRLAPLDVEILTVAATFERSTDYHDVPGIPDVGFYVALLASEPARPPEQVRLRFTGDAPLVRGGLVLLSPAPGWGADSPLVHRRVRLAERVTEFLDGMVAPPRSVLRSWARHVAAPAGGEQLLLPDRELIASAARGFGGNLIVVLRGGVGVGRKSIVGAAAHTLRRGVMVVDTPSLPTDAGELERALPALFREAALQGAVLVFDEVHQFADAEGQQALWPVLTDRIDAAAMPIALTCDRPPAWLEELERHLIELQVPYPSTDIQRRLWIRHLPPTLRLAPDVSIERIVTRYALSGGAIKDAAEELSRLDHVLGRGGVIAEHHLADVVRSRLAHRLGTLAAVVHTTLVWDDVILPEEVLDPVFELLNYAAQRDKVMADWGFGRKLPYGRGLSALFSGPPGTGKTMICAMLAKELGLELYRIDLSQVVSKYIGETEKNLGRVFDEASRGQVMLLFDEADSIFAKRTEVKSSHDRYANLEVNYLLQRMEAHDGIVVLTTNSETAIDPAFRRRIRFRIRFPAPDETHRTRLWRGMVPGEATLADDIDFAVLAKRFPLAGGNIMNALVRAATAAAADGSPITQRHLLRAAELEYQEMGFLA